jgi:hypothetical protein
MSPFKSFVFQFLGLSSIPPFSRIFKSSIDSNVRNIRELRKNRKFAQAVRIGREWKKFRRYSLPLAREIARVESGGRYWQEAAESWQVVCGFPVGTKRKDWMQLAKVQQTAGLCEDAITTLLKIQQRYPGCDVTAPLERMQNIQSGYERVDQQVLACEPGAYKITYFKNKESSNTVVITFGIIYSDFISTPFGFPFVTREGFDHIHVAQERYTFYQLLDLNVFLAAVGGVCRGKNVVAYGSSLGAYAAFYFGGPLGAKILAASPRNSVDPCITKFSKHWSHLKWMHGKISDHEKSPEKPVIFWDPLADKRDDVYLRERILPAYPDLEIIGIPEGGHSTFQFLRDKKILKDVFLSVVRGDFSAEKTKESLGLSTDPAE